VSPADREERTRTRFVQQGGRTALLGALLRAGLTRPVRFARAKRLAWRQYRRSDRGWRWHLADLAQACVLREWLADSRAEHLHAHFATNAAEVAMLCRVLGGPPYSFTVHGPDEIERAEWLGLDQKVARAEFVAVISEYCRGQVGRWCRPEDRSRLHVVRCGLDEDALAADPQPADESPRLVHVGRLCEQKGQTLLVEAAARLADEGIAFELLLIGDGPLRGEIEARVRARGLEDCVRLIGWQDGDAVRKHLRDGRALVLPSFAEGLPVVIMEALALERPVISTPVAGIPELVDAECGWLVPPGDVSALAGAMRECLACDADRLRRLGRAGALRVRERHDVRREARVLAERIAGA
jgi:glycosyltransferase involved in cell wall biosynthesis